MSAKTAGSIRIALAGNPNCGKTTIFNNITGAKQHVGNYPDVTVEKKEGKIIHDKCKKCHGTGTVKVRKKLKIKIPAGVDDGARLRVATKYTHTAREFFAAKGVHVDIIKLYGSMELAPLIGMADAIVDLVSSGNTLKANQLVEVEHIMPISSRLVINHAALKHKQEPIRRLIGIFAAAIAQ